MSGAAAVVGRENGRSGARHVFGAVRDHPEVAVVHRPGDALPERDEIGVQAELIEAVPGVGVCEPISAFAQGGTAEPGGERTRDARGKRHAAS